MHCYDSFAGAYLISYRDPNIEETFSVYDQLSTMLAADKVDQETLDGYILACYSAYAMPEGELSGAIAAITSRLCGEPEDLKIRYMEELKSLTPARLQAYAAAYRELAENGHRFTVGSERAVSSHEEMYDRILRPFSI
jgi:Zn-dependent M16 (insulinase) family peptidase